MQDTSGVIFLLTGGEVTEMREVPYEAEAVLQQLIADYPSLLAGEQIDAAEPRRWVLVAKEAGLPGAADASDRWAIDHVLIDQDAVPTIVEVKRSSDTRIRREVVGQMLDYAANATVYWPASRLRGWFEQRAGDPEDAAALLRDALGVDDIESFWGAAQRNLETGALRLVFLADAVPPELRRIVEFLDEQMSRTQVLAIEVRRYGIPDRDDTTALVPRVVARSARVEATKIREQQPSRQWSRETWFAALADRGDAQAVAAAEALVRWAEQRGLRLWYGKGRLNGSIYAMVDDEAGQSHWTFSLWTDGNVVVETANMRKSAPFAEAASRLELLQRLNGLPGLALDENRVDGWQRLQLASLRGPTLDGFLATYDWVLDRLAATPNRP